MDLELSAAFFTYTDLAALKHLMGNTRRQSALGADDLHVGNIGRALLAQDLSLLTLLTRLLMLLHHVEPFDNDAVGVFAFEDTQNLPLFSTVFSGQHDYIVALFDVHDIKQFLAPVRRLY